jgi:hypothetical protein
MINSEDENSKKCLNEIKNEKLRSFVILKIFNNMKGDKF